VPEHRALLPKLAEAVAPGGQLAIQMPANHDHQSHIVADAVAMEEPFLSAMDGHVRNWPVLPVEEYATILDGLGFAALEVSMRIYVHHLPDRGEVVEWTKGTYLTHYQARLSPKLFEQYRQAYRERLTAVLPDKRPFVYTYKRILIHGTKT
jgi:trans-aconitate 2-methyltransferase